MRELILIGAIVVIGVGASMLPRTLANKNLAGSMVTKHHKKLDGYDSHFNIRF
jgi:hypothetical protein